MKILQTPTLPPKTRANIPKSWKSPTPIWSGDKLIETTDSRPKQVVAFQALKGHYHYAQRDQHMNETTERPHTNVRMCLAP